MNLKSFMGLTLVAVFLIFAAQYSILTLGATDDGASVNASYSDQYNTTTDVTIITFSFMKFLIFIMAAAILIAAIRLIKT